MVIKNGWFLLLILMCAFQHVVAQNGLLEGIILDQNNRPLPQVSVHVGKQGTTSARDGKFYFSEISAGKHLLEITAVGYTSRTDSITKHASENLVLEITLIPMENTLHEVRIQGKSERQKINEQPIRAVVIDTRAASARASSLTDLMNRGSGIRIRQNGGLGSQPEVSINGFQGRAIKYFKDGIPLDYLGQGYQLSSLPLEALERVEVYKGVLPISLGADALGGAVNLVTRKATGTALNTFYEIGSFNTHRFGLMGTRESTNKSWFLGTDFFVNYADNDYTADVDVVDPETKNILVRRLPLFHNAFKNYYGEFFVGIQHQSWADELRLSLTAFALEQEQQHPALMSDAYGQVHSKQQSIVPTLRYKKSFLQGKIVVDQFSSYNDLNTQRIDTLMGRYDWFGHFTPSSSAGESRLPSLSDIHEKQSTARTNVLYKMTPTSSIGLNYVFTNAKRSGSDPYGPRIAGTDKDVLSLTSSYQKHVLGISMDHHWLENKLHHQVMVKFYRYDASGIQNAWFSSDVSEADERTTTGNYGGFADALKYQLSPSSLVRTSFEYAYRLPERDELFGNQVFVVPNFELNPEKSLNVNLGYQYHHQQTFFAELNGFYRRTKDLILLVPIQAPNAQYQNQEHVKGYGVDLDLSYQALKSLKISANASWQNLRLFGISDFQEQWKNKARLRNTPYFFANAAIQSTHHQVLTPKDELSLFLHYNFIREFYLETIPKDMEPGGFLGLSGSAGLNSNLSIPNQHLLNLGFTYKFAAKPISLGAEVRNLLNTPIFDYYRIPRPGRGMSLKLSYTL